MPRLKSAGAEQWKPSRRMDGLRSTWASVGGLVPFRPRSGSLSARSRTRGKQAHTGRRVRLLAEARQRGDGELAAQAADWFADRIRREREKVSATGMVNLHDWHEIATELAEELNSSA